MIPILTNILQRGWNHWLVKIFPFLAMSFRLQHPLFQEIFFFSSLCWQHISACPQHISQQTFPRQVIRPSTTVQHEDMVCNISKWPRSNSGGGGTFLFGKSLFLSWWNFKHLLFSSRNLGEDEQILTMIFQLGASTIIWMFPKTVVPQNGWWK